MLNYILIGLLFLTVIVFLIRITFLTILSISRYISDDETDDDKSKKFIPKSDEELLKSKGPKIQKVQDTPMARVERFNENDLDAEVQNENDAKIVGIVEPVGVWTSLILGGRLSALLQSANTINQRKHKGFWASMIEANARSQEKTRSRV